MGVSLKEFNAIREYIDSYLKSYTVNVEDILKECSYEKWVEQYKPKREKKQITGKYSEEWKLFWAQWPSMRSFEYKGQKFTCNKPFKANEEKLYQKYVAILEDKKENITADQLYECAKKALVNCMEESCRRGTNQMEYHSGMEPWLNQRQYRNWIHIQLKEVIEEQESFNCG